MRVAIYVRGSEADDREQQQARCRERARAMGAESVTVFDDGSASAANMNRPELQRLLKSLGEYDTLVIDRSTALSRNALDYGKLLEALDAAGVQLIAGTDTDAIGGWSRAWRFATGDAQ